MRASALLGWRIAAVVVFGVTAALAVVLTRGAPMHAALTSASHPGHPAQAGQAAHLSQAAKAAAAPCAASGLHISIGAGPQAASSYRLDFTNVSRSSCTLTGYPVVAAYRDDHVRVGNPASQDTAGPNAAGPDTAGPNAAGPDTGGAAAAQSARRVLLAPGATAHAALTVNTGIQRGACRPVVAAGLRVLAPGGSVPSYLRHPIRACSAAGPRAPVFLRVRSLKSGPA
jgi:Protein of unknown function (DUF4232)